MEAGIKRVRRSFDITPLKDGGFRRLLGAEGASSIGDWALVAVFAFAVLELGGSEWEVGLVLGAEYLASIPLVLFGGVYGDRLSQRAVMIAADLLRGTALLLVAVAFLLDSGAVWQLVLVQLVLGAGQAFYEPAQQAIVPQTVSGSALQAGNGMRDMLGSSSKIAGPLLGGVLCAWVGAGWAIALDALTFIASAILLSGLRPRFPIEPERELPIRQGLKEGWETFRTTDWLWRTAVGFGILNSISYAPLFLLGPVVAASAYGGVGAWTLLLAACAVGGIGGASFALAWKPARSLVAGISAALLGLPLFVLLAVEAPLPAIIASAVPYGFGESVFVILWSTAIQGPNVPVGQRARVASYDWLSGFGLLPAGFLFSGFTSEAIGPSGGLILAASILAIVTVILIASRSIRDFVETPKVLPGGDDGSAAAGGAPEAQPAAGS